MESQQLSAEASRHESEACMEWIRTYARTRLNIFLADEQGCIPPNVMLDFGRRGLFGLTAPIKHGGLALRLGDAFQVLRQISIVDLSIGNMVGMHNFLGGRVLLEFATLGVRDEYIADFASGRQLAAFALTEFGAGSDPRRITSIAQELENGSWEITGHKVWIGLAAWASVAVVFAQAKDLQGLERGITAFAVPLDLPGVRHGHEALTMGLRSVVQSELLFNRVQIPSTHVLGTVGSGMHIAQRGMMLGRLAIAVFANAGMLRAASILGSYVSWRKISTGQMADNPNVADMVARERARTHALNLFLKSNFAQLNDGAQPSDLIYLAAKIVGPEQAWITIDRSMQMLGGRGYLEPTGLARIFRDTRIFRIFEGPTEALISYLGGLTSAKPECIRETFDELGGADIYVSIRPRLVAGELRLAENRNLDRNQLLRRQFDAGRITAFALFLAVVRQVATHRQEDLLALRIAEELLTAAVASPSSSEPWCNRHESDCVGEIIDQMVGDLFETKGGIERERLSNRLGEEQCIP